MFNAKTFAKTLAAAAIAALAFIAPASADTTNVAFAHVSGLTSIPIGAAEFCKARPAECMPNAVIVDNVTLSETNWAELLEVNTYFNQTIAPVSDADLYQVEEFWTYPNGYGDCEDFALAKRRALIERGWPASTLLMAVVRQANGEGHAVLMVRTDRGDLILDNQVGSIDVWNNTPYHFLKRQSQVSAAEWVDINDDREPIITAAQ